MKKILLIVPDVNIGGVGRVISNISDYLADNYEFTVCVFDLTNSFYSVRGNLIDLKIPNGKNPIAYLLNQLRRSYKVRQLKRKESFDISISFIASADYVNCLTKGKEQVILSLRNPYDQDYLHRNFEKYFGNTKLATKIKNFVYRRADFIVPNSRRGLIDLSEISGLDKSNISYKCIQNFVDIEKITVQMKEPLERNIEEIFESSRVLLNVSRLYHQKGVDLLLSIFRKFNSKENKLVIIGDGNLRNELINYSKELSFKTYCIWSEDVLDDSYDVYFLGAQKNPYQFMDRATLFLFPTRFEGFPNTIIESLVCGLPVLCSDCISGPREILCPGTDLRSTATRAERGFGGSLLPLVENDGNTIDEWVKEIKRILQNDQELSLMSTEAISRATDFGKERILFEWSQLFEEAI